MADEPTIHSIDKKLDLLMQSHERIEEYIFGNGKKGLRDRVRALENWRTYVLGGAAGIVFIIGIAYKAGFLKL